jgi:hypothetical protein
MGAWMAAFELRGGETIEFQSLEELAEWVRKESSAMSWLNGHVASERRGDPFSHQETYREILRLVDAGEGSNAFEKFASAFGPKGQLIRSESPQGRYLTGLAKISVDVANAAVHLMGRADQYKGRLPDDFRRRAPDFLAAAVAVQAMSLAEPVISADLDAIREDGRRAVDRLEGREQQFSEESRSELERLGTERKRQAEQHGALLAEQRESFESLLESVKSNFEEIRGHYENQLALQSPVGYWRSVKEGARKAALFWGAVFAVLVVALVILIAGEAPAIRDFLATTERESLAVIFAVAFSTVVIWALRMVARIFLSNYHRSVDAAERETMVKTFLALRREKHIGNEELALVLAPIFRPGTTGLVKDDAAPEFGLSALLSRDRRTG